MSQVFYMLKWVGPDAIDCATLIDFEYFAEGAPWTAEPTFGGQHAVIAVIAVIQCCSAFTHCVESLLHITTSQQL